MGSYKQALAGHNSNIEMSSFRDFKQNALWSGQSEKHTRSVSVFPHRNAGYYAYNLCSPQSLRRRAHSVERDCITPERDFFTPERELFTPEREFFEKNLDPEEVWTKLKRKVFPLDPLPEPRVVRSRVVRSMEREMPHSRQAKVVLGHPRPVPHIQYNSLSNKPPIMLYRSKVKPQNSLYKHDRNLYLASTPRKKSFFPIFQHKT